MVVPSWLAWLVLLPLAPQTPAPGAATSALPASPGVDVRARATTQGRRAEIARLDGHAVTILESPGDDDAAAHPTGPATAEGAILRYVIEDIAGQGPPWIGVVRARGSELWLETPESGTLRLLGPLARPRIAGPEYKVWVIGELRADGTAIAVRRLGVLANPSQRGR